MRNLHTSVIETNHLSSFPLETLIARKKIKGSCQHSDRKGPYGRIRDLSIVGTAVFYNEKVNEYKMILI